MRPEARNQKEQPLMSAPGSHSPHPLEIAHVLFMDIVAYSTLPMDQQGLLLGELQEAVRNTVEFARGSAEDQLIRLPTGDGMALVFFRDPEAPIRCAIELSQALREHPKIKLRMGIHTGPVYRVADINANRNVAGGGINVAQRVMDCGDAGHILLSKASADVLREVGGWKDSLKDLGELKVKHGLRLHLYEISKEEGAWRERPKKLRLMHVRRWAGVLAILLSVLAIATTISVVIFFNASNRGRIDTIAVLPFENRSNPDADYISDGIAESINNSLARLPNLGVIPNSLAYHFKGKAIDLQKVGDELHVEAVLAGSIVERGENLVVNVELDDVRKRRQLWGEQYNRKLSDLLAMQSDIAKEVSQRLRSQLSAEDKQRLTKGSTANPEAYQLYLKGKYYTNKFTKDGFDKGLDYFHQAIAIDPNYARAYNGLAYNYMNQDDWFMPPHDAGPKAKDAAKKALAIDESDAEAHISQALELNWYEWNWAAAEQEYKRAIELSPDNSEAHAYYSWFLASMQRKDEALQVSTRSQQLDPLSSLSNGLNGAVLVYTRQWDAAIDQLKAAIELDPAFWFDHIYLGMAYEEKGRLPEAISEFERALDLEKDNTEIWSGLGHAFAVSGNGAEARKVLDHLKVMSAHEYVAPYNVAIIYAGLGDKGRAFPWLEQAYKDRSFYLAAALTADSRLDGLRSDQRLVDLLRRIGLEGASVEATKAVQ
jgi:TolB-like protein/Tfp pilus assembly protein PilF/class 3 adenylate cyclase